LRHWKFLAILIARLHGRKIVHGTLLVVAIIGLLSANLAEAACTKPQAPVCALQGSFAKASDQDQCRLQMLPYRGAMETFAECLKQEGRDDKPALDELEYTLAEFNRRSRELPADDL
jgi:hypothetical protein